MTGRTANNIDTIQKIMVDSGIIEKVGDRRDLFFVLLNSVRMDVEEMEKKLAAIKELVR